MDDLGPVLLLRRILTAAHSAKHGVSYPVLAIPSDRAWHAHYVFNKRLHASFHLLFRIGTTYILLVFRPVFPGFEKCRGIAISEILGDCVTNLFHIVFFWHLLPGLLFNDGNRNADFDERGNVLPSSFSIQWLVFIRLTCAFFPLDDKKWHRCESKDFDADRHPVSGWTASRVCTLAHRLFKQLLGARFFLFRHSQPSHRGHPPKP